MAVRKVRVLIQVGTAESYSTKQFVERDISIEVRDDEDMTKQLRFLMSDEFEAVKQRLEKFPEARPVIEVASDESRLIGKDE